MVLGCPPFKILYFEFMINYYRFALIDESRPSTVSIYRRLDNNFNLPSASRLFSIYRRSNFKLPSQFSNNIIFNLLSQFSIYRCTFQSTVAIFNLPSLQEYFQSTVANFQSIVASRLDYIFNLPSHISIYRRIKISFNLPSQTFNLPSLQDYFQSTVAHFFFTGGP